MRHEVSSLLRHRSMSGLEWRQLLLLWIPLAWLLYFMMLAVLTAIYTAVRKRSARKLTEEEVNEGDDAAVKRAHSRRFSTVPMGDDEEDTTRQETVQSGYQTWFFGLFLYCLWILVPILSQVQLAWLTCEQYFGFGWDATAKQFILIYVISHVLLFLATKFSGQVKTFFLQPSPLAEATHIAIFPRDKTKGLAKLEVVRVRHFEEDAGSPVEGRYYEHTCVRYLWCEDARRFRPSGLTAPTGEEAYQALDRGGLDEKIALARLAKQGSNTIKVKVKGILASLMAEYSEPTYVFQMMCIWCYLFWNSWNVAFLWVLLVFGSGAWTSLMILRRNQQQIAEMAAAGATRTQKVLRSGQWMDVKVTDLTVGDVVQVCDGIVCADIVLVSGSAVVNESMLTGEPMPLQKVGIEQNSKLAFDYKRQGKKHGLFAGTEILQSVADEAANASRGSTFAVGVVMAIGGRTTKGKLIRMVLYPATVKFKYTEQLPIVYSFMTLWAMICFVNTLLFQGQGWVNGCFAGMAFLTQAVNPMMAVSFTLGQSCSAGRLSEGGIACLNIGRIPVAGKISTMVFDKTGTITYGGMDLAAVRPIADSRFQEEVAAPSVPSLQHEILLQALASCHSLSTMHDGSLVGNQVEIVTLKALGWQLSAPGEPRVITSPDGSHRLEVLRQLEFDHHRMTSGSVVRCTNSGRVLAFCKGAYDKISQIADASSVPADYKDVCEAYAAQCFYVLSVSFKELPAHSAVEEMTRDSLEQGLQLCGLLFFRNEMKPDSREVIEELVDGGINCVICTGDNTTTGVSIGRQCSIVSSKSRVLIGEMEDAVGGDVRWRDADAKDAKIPDWRSVAGCELALSQSAFKWLVKERPEELTEMLPFVKVFGRMKPDDKIKVISLWQEHGADGTVTGMTGDGGNDCGALRTAHAGIALSEAEASMVSPFSSSRGFAEKGFISLSAVVELIKEGRCCLATNMATFMYFMVYNLTLTSSKIAVITWTDSTYSEWQFIMTDVGLAMIMVSFMVRCRPEKKLAATSPSASLFGTSTTVTVLSALLIYWLTAGIALLLLQYGPGRSFYEFSTTILSEIPTQEWTRKSDNYLIATLFLVNLTVLLNTGFVLCYGHVHRQVVSKNWRMCTFYFVGILLTLALTWMKPNDLTCLFRINCDTSASRQMSIPFISKPVGGITFSCGSLGGCFLGPQMVSCKSEDRRCWITPPNEFHLKPSWSSALNVSRPKAPFDTRLQKIEYCRQHAYKSGAESLGNKWCWKPLNGEDPLTVCGPLPSRDLGPMVEGCSGPNNCFGFDFKVALTVVLALCGVALHAMYKLGVLGISET
eukprot:CAMPEP_0181411004 /NCGR_PEP_ID=MMETSP1110-20121109/7641_1 /TAXON_ID=174948 /ORGANISM="Symbiodinium sp., Strain CCMP421" /LENGTH=1321 /DNA_ID=CAMNT_0023533589 /DNA_START=112 /DNA_END=4077 /DNA_ORIENTATION=-